MGGGGGDVETQHAVNLGWRCCMQRIPCRLWTLEGGVLTAPRRCMWVVGGGGRRVGAEGASQAGRQCTLSNEFRLTASALADIDGITSDTNLPMLASQTCSVGSD